VMAVMHGFPYIGLRFEVEMVERRFSISSNGHWLGILPHCRESRWPDFAEPRYGLD
jgi:hypothetical protein